MQIDWSLMKTVIDDGASYRFFNIGGSYYIYAVDSVFQFTTTIAQDGNDDQVDFETNYKSKASSSISQTDVDGAEIVRIKAAKKGWTYWAACCEITTATDNGSLFAQDSTGAPIRGLSVSLLDSKGIAVDAALATQTVLDFEPQFDYEIIGGSLRINQTVSQDVRFWIVAAPDIPAQLGGSKEMASGINLKFLAPGNLLEVDGRVTKVLTYNPNLHTNKIRIICKHDPGVVVTMQISFEVYRQ